MHKQNLPLVAAVAALALAGSSIASRFEAEMATSELAAQQAVSNDARRVGNLNLLAEADPSNRFPETRTSRPALGLTDADTDTPTNTDAADLGNGFEDFGDLATWPVDTTTIPSPGTSTTTSTSTPSAPPPSITNPDTTVPAPAPTELDWDSASVGDRGLEALTLVDYPWKERLPEWEIRFHEGKDGAYGYTLTQESVIDIYVRDNQSKQLLAHVIAHELGHAVDVTLNNGDDRRRWQTARGIEDAPWWPDNRASDFSTGAGDFAESFAAWQVGTESYRSRLADPPSDDQTQLLIELSEG